MIIMLHFPLKSQYCREMIMWTGCALLKSKATTKMERCHKTTSPCNNNTHAATATQKWIFTFLDNANQQHESHEQWPEMSSATRRWEWATISTTNHAHGSQQQESRNRKEQLVIHQTNKSHHHLISQPKNWWSYLGLVGDGIKQTACQQQDRKQ